MCAAEKKRNYMVATKREIIKFLKSLGDGEYCRNKDILTSVKGSSATVQKHLNELAKGMVERKIDLESKEYPHPVYYRLKPQYVKNPLEQREKDWLNAVLNKPLDRREVKDDLDISHYVEFLNVQTGAQVLNQIKWFLDKKNEFAFSQAIDLWVLAIYRENAFRLKEKLEKLAAKGVNVKALIYDAEQRMLRHFKHLQKER